MTQVARAKEHRKQAEGGPRSSVSYLWSMDIFQDLNSAEIYQVHLLAPIRRCRRGMVFFRPGDSGEQLFLLKEGRVTVYRLTPDGHKLVVDVVEAGTIFGEMAIAGQSMQECFAETHEDSLVCTIAPAQMERILQQYPPVARRLLEALGRRVQYLEERLVLMAYVSVRERLARFLLARARPATHVCKVSGSAHDALGAAARACRATARLAAV